MPAIPHPTQGGDFTPAPAGTFAAICFRIVDLGKQKQEFNGETKIQHQLMISWEIADEEERMADGRPFTVSKWYTWSMHEKSNLRKDLENWRGAPFKESDFGTFKLESILGVPCMLSLVHAENKAGNTNTRVASVSKMPKNLIAAQLVNPVSYVWLERDEFDKEAFDALSDKLKETIMKSPEWAMLKNPHREAPPGATAAPRSTITSGGAQLRATAQPAKVWDAENDPLAGLEARG